jgi:hypothetical protein
MSTFDDLRNCYITWRSRNKTYFDHSWQFIRNFVVDFRSYIGAPELYAESTIGMNDPQKAPKKRYVDCLKAIKNDKGELQLVDAKSPMEAVTPDGDGYWISGIKVTIDIALNAHPKHDFQFPVRFTLRPDQAQIQIGDEPGGTFPIDAADPASFEPAYDYMIALLRDLFELQPWSSAKKVPIGFAPPQAETP